MPRSLRSNPKTKHFAVHLRKVSTPAEQKLWMRIRNDQLGITFRRQHAIGNYIVDFCAPRKKLIIELDGSQHLEQQEYDDERTKYLEARGYRVLRFWNKDVMTNMESVLQVIWRMLNEEKGMRILSHDPLNHPLAPRKICGQVKWPGHSRC